MVQRSVNGIATGVGFALGEAVTRILLTVLRMNVGVLKMNEAPFTKHFWYFRHEMVVSRYIPSTAGGWGDSRELGETGAPNFRGTYRDVQNKERPCYTFPKREACRTGFLLVGLRRMHVEKSRHKNDWRYFWRYIFIQKSINPASMRFTAHFVIPVEAPIAIE